MIKSSMHRDSNPSNLRWPGGMLAHAPTPHAYDDSIIWSDLHDSNVFQGVEPGPRCNHYTFAAQTSQAPHFYFSTKKEA